MFLLALPLWQALPLQINMLFRLSLSLMVGLRMLGAGVILLLYYRKKSHRLTFVILNMISLFYWVSLCSLCLFPHLFKAYALKNMLTSKAAFIGKS